MTAFISTTTLLAVLAGAVGPARGEPAERQVVLEIDGTKLLDKQIASATEDTLFFVRSDSTKALSEAHGVKVVDDQAAPAILVSLSWVNYSESIYGVRLEARRPGEEAELVETFECTCVDSELTAAVIARLPAALEQLEKRTPEPAPADPAATGGDPSSDEPAVTAPPDPVDRDPAPLGAMGKAGIGLLAGGVAGVVAGGIVFAQGRKPDQAPGWAPDETGRDFAPPGIALMVSGGVAFVTGAILLGVDRRKAHRKASAAIIPAPNGIFVTGRF